MGVLPIIDPSVFLEGIQMGLRTPRDKELIARLGEQLLKKAKKTWHQNFTEGLRGWRISYEAKDFNWTFSKPTDCQVFSQENPLKSFLTTPKNLYVMH